MAIVFEPPTQLVSPVAPPPPPALDDRTLTGPRMRPCGVCGFRPAALRPGAAPAGLRDLARRWVALLDRLGPDEAQPGGGGGELAAALSFADALVTADRELTAIVEQQDVELTPRAPAFWQALPVPTGIVRRAIENAAELLAAHVERCHVDLRQRWGRRAGRPVSAWDLVGHGIHHGTHLLAIYLPDRDRPEAGTDGEGRVRRAPVTPDPMTTLALQLADRPLDEALRLVRAHPGIDRRGLERARHQLVARLQRRGDDHATTRALRIVYGAFEPATRVPAAIVEKRPDRRPVSHWCSSCPHPTAPARAPRTR